MRKFRFSLCKILRNIHINFRSVHLSIFATKKLMDKIELYAISALDWFIKALPNMLLAVVVMFGGLWLIKKACQILNVTLETSGFTHEIKTFLVSLANIGLKGLLLISVAGMIGVNTAAFVGILAAAGLAVGLALQGSLGNFAAGIIIVTFKPYKVEDWIEVKDKFGKVQDIQIFNTVVVTPGNKTLVIPNGEVISGIITNYSRRGSIRIELKVKISYIEDFPRFKELVLSELSKIDKILKDPAPEIGIEEFGETNLSISIRPYVRPDDYWPVYYEVMRNLKAMYNHHDIKISFADGISHGQVGK
jgi:small conductance mechanosensitive channel